MAAREAAARRYLARLLKELLRIARLGREVFSFCVLAAASLWFPPYRKHTFFKKTEKAHITMASMLFFYFSLLMSLFGSRKTSFKRWPGLEEAKGEKVCPSSQGTNSGISRPLQAAMGNRYMATSIVHIC